jgi:hypothetical protein
MIAGPSQSGKSTLLAKILHNNKIMITPQPTRIIYCYARWSNDFEKLKLVYPIIEFREGLPDIDEFSANQNNLLILDDLMTAAEKDKTIVDLFTTDSHHKNISVFIITQNLFSQGKFTRTISLNCQYMLLLNNPRDRAQIYSMARQIFPTNPKFLVECYEDATSVNYGYLFLDLSQFAHNNYRVQTDIMPDNERTIYQEKD